MRTHFTKKQIEVNNWINDIGFQTEMEKVFGRYCVDIYIPELNVAVELDGFGHWPKKDEKRDAYLMHEQKILSIFHVVSKISKKDFYEDFKFWVNMVGGKDEE